MSCFAKQDPSTRGYREGCRAHAAAFLLSAVLIWSLAATAAPAREMAGPAFSLSTPLQAASAATSMPLRSRGGHALGAVERVVEREITETTVPPGGESLSLAARLVKNGGLIVRPIQWRIYRLDEGKGAPVLLHEALRPRQRLALSPGSYGVEVRYGQRKAWHVLHLRPGKSQRVVFVLNVGGIRMLSTLEGVRAPGHGPVEYRVLKAAVSGWREVTRTRTPGEIVRLPAGRYRVESLFLNGNVKASADVLVKPGRLHSLHLRVKASLAEVVGAPRKWEIVARDNSWRWRGSGAARMVLAPGSYVWRTDNGERVITVRGGEHLRLR